MQDTNVNLQNKTFWKLNPLFGKYEKSNSPDVNLFKEPFSSEKIWSMQD